ncbi:hypothetical protein [Dictyobacter halimunensis]|uniref:hypothetical protein n=1 Tax=Dictyobacter halimunensis TaxID=3026934 RepID=UPI0030C6FB28
MVIITSPMQQGLISMIDRGWRLDDLLNGLANALSSTNSSRRPLQSAVISC